MKRVTEEEVEHLMRVFQEPYWKKTSLLSDVYGDIITRVDEATTDEKGKVWGHLLHELFAGVAFERYGRGGILTHHKEKPPLNNNINFYMLMAIIEVFRGYYPDGYPDVLEWLTPGETKDKLLAPLLEKAQDIIDVERL